MKLLGLINFVILQWFGVRLARVGQMTSTATGLEFRPTRWKVLRWVVPLTGWWSDFRWIARDK